MRDPADAAERWYSDKRHKRRGRKTDVVEPRRGGDGRYRFSESFQDEQASDLFSVDLLDEVASLPASTLLDHVRTRGLIKRMHYFAYRADVADGDEEHRRWFTLFQRTRGVIVERNVRLCWKVTHIFRYLDEHVREDFAAELVVHMFHVLSTYDPYEPANFSSYAFSALSTRLRELFNHPGRKSEFSTDFADKGGWADKERTKMDSFAADVLGELLDPENTTLNDDEKLVVRMRFGVDAPAAVFREIEEALGKSSVVVKRRLQSAIEKIRFALADFPGFTVDELKGRALTRDERSVLKYFFGLGDAALTLDDIASRLEVKRGDAASMVQSVADKMKLLVGSITAPAASDET